jgi:hypothetical protein
VSYTDTLLDQAAQALQEGRKGEVRRLVAPIVDAEPGNGRAWHLLADAADDEAQAQIYRDRAAQSGMLTPPRGPIPQPQQPQYQQQPQPMQYAQQPQYQQQPPTRQSAFTPFSPPPPAPRNAPAAAGAMLGGAAAIILGSLLPWATVSAGIFQRSVNGIDGDGKITIVAGVFALIAGIALFTSTSKAARILGALSGIAAGGIAAWDLMNILQINNTNRKLAAISEALDGGPVRATADTAAGIGLYLIIIGALIVLIGTGLQTKPKYPTYQQPQR